MIATFENLALLAEIQRGYYLKIFFYRELKRIFGDWNEIYRNLKGNFLHQDWISKYPIKILSDYQLLQTELMPCAGEEYYSEMKENLLKLYNVDMDWNEKGKEYDLKWLVILNDKPIHAIINCFVTLIANTFHLVKRDSQWRDSDICTKTLNWLQNSPNLKTFLTSDVIKYCIWLVQVNIPEGVDYQFHTT